MSIFKLNEEKMLEQLVQRVDYICNKEGLLASRCLATCNIIKHILEANTRLAVEWFPCGSIHMSARIIAKMKDNGGSYPATHEAALKWREQGARMLRVIPNTTALKPINNCGAIPLRGHMCLIVKGESTYFVDPTSYQFIRRKEQDDWILNAPLFIVNKVAPESLDICKTLNSRALERTYNNGFTFDFEFHCGAKATYEYTRLEQLEVDQLPSSDMNIHKFENIIAKITR